jgi:hypothetical protein
MDLGNGDATLGREILMKLDDDKRNVRFWHKADMGEARMSAFGGKADIARAAVFLLMSRNID